MTRKQNEYDMNNMNDIYGKPRINKTRLYFTHQCYTIFMIRYASMNHSYMTDESAVERVEIYEFMIFKTNTII